MIKNLKSIHWNTPVQGVWRFHIGTCRNAKNENFEFCFDCGKKCVPMNWKEPPRSFWLELFRFFVPYTTKYTKYGLSAENRHLRLKVMLRSPKLWVNLILNVIGVRLRFTGTHFDHNRYIIRIFFFFCWFSIGSYGAMQKFQTPVQGGSRIFFHKLSF